MSLGQEDLMMGIPADAQKTLPPRRPHHLGPLQPINIPPYNTNLADFAEPIWLTPVNFVLNINAPIVIYTHLNTYPTIANDDQETPNTYNGPKRNLDPQLHSTGSTRDIMKLKAIKMEISMGKINCLTHTALKPKYTLDPY